MRSGAGTSPGRLSCRGAVADPRDTRSRGLPWLRVAVMLAIVCGMSLCGGCARNRVDESYAVRMERGEYARARGHLYNRGIAEKRSDRQYLLDRQRLLVATLADGLPEHAESFANQTYEVLRIQGLNADKTVPSVVLSDGVRIWKGEPFEQALAYATIAVQKGAIGDWGNMRAAAESSLFLLRDFGTNERGERLSTLEIAQRAAREGEQAGDAYLDGGYVAIQTDFALGYVLMGIASHALGRTQEASDNFDAASRIRPGLAGVLHDILEGRANTVLIVDAGRGPAKVGYGPDNALTRFQPRTPSDTRALIVRSGLTSDVASGARIDQAADVNAMAADHTWNNLEDVRVAKSTLGSALLLGGVVVAASADNDDGTAQLIGLGVAAIGAIMKGTATADVRHLEALPQRTYIVPLDVRDTGVPISMEIEGLAQTRFVIAGLPATSEFQIRYLRLPTVPVAPVWATSGRVLYANDAWAAPVEGDGLPFIMGGRCVRVPTHEVMAHYQRAGNLIGKTLADLLELYRAEGIVFDPGDELEKPGVHVLEGGRSLATPQAGTAGFARLFGQDHPPYQPRSQELRAFIEAQRSGPLRIPGDGGERGGSAAGQLLEGSVGQQP